MQKIAEAKAKNEPTDAYKQPLGVSYGIHTVTSLVEQKKAKLVVIAHDVDPIEVGFSFSFVVFFNCVLESREVACL